MASSKENREIASFDEAIVNSVVNKTMKIQDLNHYKNNPLLDKTIRFYVNEIRAAASQQKSAVASSKKEEKKEEAKMMYWIDPALSTPIKSGHALTKTKLFYLLDYIKKERVHSKTGNCEAPVDIIALHNFFLSGDAEDKPLLVYTQPTGSPSDIQAQVQNLIDVYHIYVCYLKSQPFPNWGWINICYKTANAALSYVKTGSLSAPEAAPAINACQLELLSSLSQYIEEKADNAMKLLETDNAKNCKAAFEELAYRERKSDLGELPSGFSAIKDSLFAKAPECVKLETAKRSWVKAMEKLVMSPHILADDMAKFIKQANKFGTVGRLNLLHPEALPLARWYAREEKNSPEYLDKLALLVSAPYLKPETNREVKDRRMSVVELKQNGAELRRFMVDQLAEGQRKILWRQFMTDPVDVRTILDLGKHYYGPLNSPDEKNSNARAIARQFFSWIIDNTLPQSILDRMLPTEKLDAQMYYAEIFLTAEGGRKTYSADHGKLIYPIILQLENPEAWKIGMYWLRMCYGNSYYKIASKSFLSTEKTGATATTSPIVGDITLEKIKGVWQQIVIVLEGYAKELNKFGGRLDSAELRQLDKALDSQYAKFKKLKEELVGVEGNSPEDKSIPLYEKLNVELRPKADKMIDVASVINAFNTFQVTLENDVKRKAIKALIHNEEVKLVSPSSSPSAESTEALVQAKLLEAQQKAAQASELSDGLLTKLVYQKRLLEEEKKKAEAEKMAAVAKVGKIKGAAKQELADLQAALEKAKQEAAREIAEARKLHEQKTAQLEEELRKQQAELLLATSKLDQLTGQVNVERAKTKIAQDNLKKIKRQNNDKITAAEKELKQATEDKNTSKVQLDELKNQLEWVKKSALADKEIAKAELQQMKTNLHELEKEKMLLQYEGKGTAEERLKKNAEREEVADDEDREGVVKLFVKNISVENDEYFPQPCANESTSTSVSSSGIIGGLWKASTALINAITTPAFIPTVVASEEWEEIDESECQDRESSAGTSISHKPF